MIIFSCLCFQALQDPNVGDGWKHLLLEVVVTLAETAPAMVRKAGAKYMTSLIPLMLNMMTDLDDEEVRLQLFICWGFLNCSLGSELCREKSVIVKGKKKYKKPHLPKIYLFIFTF